MEYTLQTHGAHRTLPVPAGLRELACDLSREVLRAQPENLLGFAADYLLAMLRTRTSAVAAAEAVGEMLENDVTFGKLLEARGVTVREAQRACTIIQAAFRGFCTRRDLRGEAAYLMADPVARRYGVSRDVADRAVARIQAAFRGYMVRKILRHQQAGISGWVFEDFPRSKIIQYLLRSVSPDIANKAATKIQSVFRGYSVRQAMKECIYQEVKKELWSKRSDKPPPPPIQAPSYQPVQDYTIVDGADIIDMSSDDEEFVPKKHGKRKSKAHHRHFDSTAGSINRRQPSIGTEETMSGSKGQESLSPSESRTTSLKQGRREDEDEEDEDEEMKPGYQAPMDEEEEEDDTGGPEVQGRPTKLNESEARMSLEDTDKPFLGEGDEGGIEEEGKAEEEEGGEGDEEDAKAGKEGKGKKDDDDEEEEDEDEG